MPLKEIIIDVRQSRYHFKMTPEKDYQKECRCANSLEEICENTRAIRRVTNRILDHLHEYGKKGYDDEDMDYDPDDISWEDLNNNDDMFS